MTALFSYGSAVLAALCFGLGSVWEQIGARRVNRLKSINPFNFGAMLRQLPYLAGLSLDWLGYIFFVLAVRSLPLFFVESLSTASIAVTALGARYWLKVQLSAQEYRWMAILIVGLVILGLATAPLKTSAINHGFDFVLLGSAVITGVICALAAKFSSSSAVLAILSGICFSGVALASRLLQFHGPIVNFLASPTTLSMLLFGLLGIMLFSIALQNGSATSVYALSFVVETLLPTILGIWLFGDAPRAGWWPAMIVGFVISIVSTVAIAKSKEYVSV